MSMYKTCLVSGMPSRQLTYCSTTGSYPETLLHIQSNYIHVILYTDNSYAGVGVIVLPGNKHTFACTRHKCRFLQHIVLYCG